MMKKHIKQMKQGLAALMAAVIIFGSGVITPDAAYANEAANLKVVHVVGAINVGLNHYEMAITEDGGLWAWGGNDYGVLGTGTNGRAGTSPEDVRSPVRIMDNVAYAVAGSSTTFAVKTDGSLWAWGDHDNGRLGDGAIEGGIEVILGSEWRTNPVKIMDNVASVAAGEYNTFAIQKDGSLWSWGANDKYGRIGDGTTADRDTPVKIMENVASVIPNASSPVAIQTDGSLWAWGYNAGGQLGDGTTTHSYTPVKIMGNVASVVANRGTIFAIQTDGSLWARGSNSVGQLGDGTTTDRYSPVKIMENVTFVQNDFLHIWAIQADGSLWAWGSNTYGKLGDGTTTDRRSPVKIMENVTAVTSNSNNTSALQTDGSLWSWGEYSNIHDKNYHNVVLPIRLSPVKILDNVASVVDSMDPLGERTFAIQTDGSLWSWGSNEEGQLGDGTTNSRDTPVKILENVTSVMHYDNSKYGSVFAIKTDGSLWAWGANTGGRLGINSEDDYALTPTRVNFK
jgi:alpha-tubulin suppressor-like RCC1 family protein